MRNHLYVLVPSQWRFERSAVSRFATSGLYRVTSALAFRLEYTQAQDELLTAVVEIIASELDLPYVRIEMDGSDWGDGSASFGTAIGTPLQLPLTYQGRPAGHFVITGSRPGRPPTRRERGTMLDVARHAGAALHTARLLGDRRQSLDRVLYAREEERRRLRHELHDSLGPILAGISLGLHAAKRIMPRDPEQADQLVSHLEQELQSAIGEVRRLFETLRPPALDQLGLVAAVREHIDLLATRMRTTDDPGQPMSFELHDAGDFAALPAIVEVAAYRIICEALTNVARHSGANSCSVTLRRDKGVRIEICDNGVGLGAARGRGLGLGSMRERATELGGSFAIESPESGGTTVVAVLPVHPVPAAR